MPNYQGTISNLVQGDFRQVPFTIPNVPTSGALSKAWLTVKANEDDIDINALFQKIITTVLDLDQGHITADGAGVGVAAGFFNILSDDTFELTPLEVYYYDIQLMFTMADASTRIETPEKGTISVLKGITDAVS